jgi:hypothetical protein
VLSWNLNGLHATKVESYGLAALLHDAPVVLIQETQRDHVVCERLFRNHVMFSLPHVSNTR